MTCSKPLALAAALGLPLICSAQGPIFLMNDAARLTSQGFPLSTTVQAAPGTAFAVYVDFDGGPRDVLGERLLLGLTPSLTNWNTGLVDPSGFASTNTQVPLFAGALGLIVYGQALLVDPTAPNGLFRASNAASTATYLGSSAIIASFTNPISAGYTGNFSADIEGHLRGGPVTRRTVETINPGSFAVNGPIQPPLSPFGCRAQYVFKNTEIGATGSRELVTGVRWRPYYPSFLVLDDTFPSFDFRIGHSDVVPDYSVDLFSALPVAPNSGLSATFADNEQAGEPPVVVYQGPYEVSPNDATATGYLPYPMFAPFEYDGVSSLLLDFRVGPGLSQGLNGQAMRIQIQSDALPGARVVRTGTSMNPILPGQVTTGSPDNAMPELEIEFTRAVTTALAPWQFAGLQPDYGTPVLAQSLPFGTSIRVRYRGMATSGSTPTAWSSTPDIADGMSFLQFEITFVANAQSGERPILDTLIVPML